MRGRVAVLAMVVSLGVVATVAVAQQPVPTVTINAGADAVAVAAAGPVAAGPTRFEVVRPASRSGHSVYVALLVPGVSLEQFQQTLERDRRQRSEAAIGLVSIQAAIALEGGQTRRAATFTVKPGLTYVVLSEVQTQGEGPSAPGQLTTFSSSDAANGAVAPAPAATVRMVDLRFRGDRVLPRRGTVRVENRGGVPHMAIAFPLRQGVTTAQLGRAVRSSSEQAFGRIVSGPPLSLQNPISGGDTANDQEVRFPRRGRYGLVCFFNEHHRLGMYRIVSVR
jgi:hypothetical protein